jgi:hypothetical protein
MILIIAGKCVDVASVSNRKEFDARRGDRAFGFLPLAIGSAGDLAEVFAFEDAVDRLLVRADVAGELLGFLLLGKCWCDANERTYANDRKYASDHEMLLE